MKGKMASGYKWRRIEDLGGDPQMLTDGELKSLWRVWQTQKKELEASREYEEFDKRLRREWAIETGIIEDVYTLDRGVTRTLIERGIDAALIPRSSTDQDPVLVARVIQDHAAVLEGMFDFVKGTRDLSTSYIKELHAALLRNLDAHTVVDSTGRVFEKPLEKGKYKDTPNSPTRPDGLVHEYAPPEHVASEMDELIRLYAAHAAGTTPVEVEAAWLHHRFTQIHPFADGNGRVARALASLVFIKAGWFPLVIRRDDRARYIDALEKADVGDLRPLVGLFVESQRASLIDATEIAYDLKQFATPHEAVLALKDRLVKRGKFPIPEWLLAKETAEQLVALAGKSLQPVADDLQAHIGSMRLNSFFAVATSKSEYDLSELQSILRDAGIVSNPVEFYTSVHLALSGDPPEWLSIGFVAIGSHFRGLVGAVGILKLGGSRPVLIDVPLFQINYEEDLETAKARFAPWLDRVIVGGLDEWRKRL